MNITEMDGGKVSEAQVAARHIARILLKKYDRPDSATIRAECGQAVTAVSAMQTPGGIDVEELCRYFERSANVFVPASQSLDDPRDHLEWLLAKRASIAWNFWERYETFLDTEEELPEDVVRSLDVETEKILERLEDPHRPAPWDRRGLVVGSVQSGKTGNFLGLTCKALDAGYKLVIILAGIHNSLRTQTQVRAEEAVLGFDTSTNRFLFDERSPRIGVGALHFDELPVNSMTTREEGGDFRASLLGPTLSLGGDPFVLVVKKNASILKNLKRWILHRHGVDNGNGGKIIRNIPLLLIDDEADHASINTRTIPEGASKDDYKVTTINERIRSLLKSFEKCAYVGYTATPFANIFVDPDARHERLQDDIFPRSFILSLPAPSNYVGAETIFGRDGDPDAGIEAVEGLPLVKRVKDNAETFPPKYAKDYAPTKLPDSLKEAIRAFVLACSARRARGQVEVHNSMLVHVVRYVAVQKHVADLVRAELSFIQRRIAHEGARDARPIRAELRELWERDFVPTTVAVNDYLCERKGQECPPLTWEELELHLHAAAAKITVREINGTSGEALEYEVNKKQGLSVIAVGGDKLSRGLTLSGLSVSYYLRISKMYDTLLQMGRWFGYRDGYLDVCRLYTTDELRRWYRHIALADRELRMEFDRMFRARATPTEYGLRVRTHPDGMLITALNKSRCSSTMKVSFAGELVQTTSLYKDAGSVSHNYKTLGDLLANIGPAHRRENKDKGNAVWSRIARMHVSSFIRSIKAPPGTRNLDSDRLAAYIDRQASIGELADWTVVVASSSIAPEERRLSIASLDDVGLIARDPERESTNGKRLNDEELSDEELNDKELSDTILLMRNSNIISPPHQGLDLDELLTMELANQLVAKPVFRDGDATELQLIEAHVDQPLERLACALTDLRIRNGSIKGTAPAKTPNGRVYRDLRPVTRGLLLVYPLDWVDRRQGKDRKPFSGISTQLPLVGFAVSFPTSNTALAVEYKVTETYRRLHLEVIEQGEDDELV